jgi:hypothetical protein
MRLVPPDQLIYEWERVRAGLLRVQENSVEDWIPEDIYMSLKLNNSALYLIEDKAGDYLGFMILQVLPTFHAKRLHVWCGYSTNEQPLLRIFLREVKEIAKQCGCKSVTFTSPRDEWEKVAGRGGFKGRQTTYELEV